MSTATPARPSAPVRAAPRPALVDDALAMTGRAIRVVLRTPAAIVAAVFMPLILMLVMTAGFATVVVPDGTHRDYVNQVLPLFVVMGMSFSAITTGVSAHRDLHSGIDARLRTLPVASSAPLIGRILGDAARNLVTIVVLVLVGVALGFRHTTGPAAAVAAVLLALVFGTAFAWLAIAAAVRARSAETVATALNAVLLVLSFLSTGFVAVADLPGWAQPIARNSPVSAAIDALRALTHGGPTTAPVLKALAWSATMTAVFATSAIRHRRN